MPAVGFPMPVDLDSLNESQRTAVSWEDGPLLVLAGPGSGKTRVLTSRVARLLEEREEVAVLALTFTNKAATEMRERVEAQLAESASRAHLCTYHSFAADILRQHGSHVGLRPDFTLLTQDEDRLAVLGDLVAQLPDDGDPCPSDRRNFLSLIDRLFAESYPGTGNAPSLVKTPSWLPELFSNYCDALVAGNRLDFGSLLHFARRLLETRPGVARVVRAAWTHVCIDEFQDTNRAQYDLLRLIAPGRRHHLFVVGDDDQIIYQWNGASPQRLAQLQKHYDMAVVQLPECFRCPSPVIVLANRLISNNRMRQAGKAPLATTREAGLDDSVVRYGEFESPDEEAEFISSDIKRRGLEPGHCAVLGRAAKLLEPTAEALRRGGFEAHLVRRKTDFEAAPVRLFMAALRQANSPHDRHVLRRLCLAWEGLTGRVLEVDAVAAAAALAGGDFLRAWADAASIGASRCAATALGRIRKDLVDGRAFPSIVVGFLDGSWRSWTEAADQELVEDEVATWKELHDEIEDEYRSRDLTLNAYLQQMDLQSKAPRPEPNAVRCMTVHGSKGLEFRHVYLIGVAQRVLPSFYALRKGADSVEMEEERRNCFVAITRVEETLTLTRSKRYYGRDYGPSQFLCEMEIGNSA